MREIKDPNERRVGPYTVVGTLARGATSEVVKAIDPDLNRTVAVKVLSAELVKDADSLARFERESRAVTILDHPNIARIYDTGVSTEGQPYLVMEYVDGRSMMDLIHDKIEFPLSQQIDMIIQAAEGLNAALNRQIIHRDIKPANLMIDRDFNLKVIDFGLAKVISEDAYKSVAGVVMGTPRYMAPEVALGRTADYRSDIYSLAATFYHLATGQPPFDGDTPAAVMMQHVNSPLTPAYMINPQIPADVCEIMEKAMAKDINHRYQDYSRLIGDLKEAKMARLAREKHQAGGAGPDEEAYGGYGDDTPTAEYEGYRPASSRGDMAQAAQERGEGHSLYRSAAEPVVQTYEPKPEKAPSGNRTLLLLALLLVVAVGSLMLATFSGESGEDESGLSKILSGITSIFSKKGKTTEEVYYDNYIKTVEQIDFLEAAVREYVAAAGMIPSSLDDLVDKKIVSEDELLDGFGGRIIYEPPTRSIRAPGPDGILNTLDDFLSDVNGRLVQFPEKPETLSMEEFITIRGE